MNIETERLILRNVAAKDADTIFDCILRRSTAAGAVTNGRRAVLAVG